MWTQHQTPCSGHCHHQSHDHPLLRIKYSTSDKTCQQVGRPILSSICTLGMENVLAPTKALGVPMSLCVFMCLFSQIYIACLSWFFLQIYDFM